MSQVTGGNAAAEGIVAEATASEHTAAWLKECLDTMEERSSPEEQAKTVLQCIALAPSRGKVAEVLRRQQRLSIFELPVQRIPSSLGDVMSNLTELCLVYLDLTELPWSIGHLRHLSTLLVDGNRLTAIPSSISTLPLTSLSAVYNKLVYLPPLQQAPALVESRNFNFGHNPLAALPWGLFGFRWDYNIDRLLSAPCTGVLPSPPVLSLQLLAVNAAFQPAGALTQRSDLPVHVQAGVGAVSRCECGCRCLYAGPSFPVVVRVHDPTALPQHQWYVQLRGSACQSVPIPTPPPSIQLRELPVLAAAASHAAM